MLALESQRENAKQRTQVELPATVMPSLSIPQFCKAENLSRSMFYKLDRAGRAPRTIRLGNRRTITPAFHDEWRRAREAEQTIT